VTLPARLRAILVPALILGLVPVLAAGQAPPKSREQTLSVARRIMIDARFCTLVTIGEGNEPQARIVDPLEPDTALAVYVATNPRSRKVAEIRKDPRVTLLYFDPARFAYVTLVGRAVEVHGAEKAAHRKKDWQEFFPAEKPESYLLYRIVPSRAEVVSARDGLNGDPVTWRPEIVELR
jgi:general stress protein 26